MRVERVSLALGVLWRSAEEASFGICSPYRPRGVEADSIFLAWLPRLFERHCPLAAAGEAEPEATETVQRIDPVDADFKTRLRALPQHGHRMRDDRRAHTVDRKSTRLNSSH